ncbi:MAG: CZB domain-containing protein [Gemmatimonadetes bacterium]|nr:CZB domain-containing protein [Gemmatimonadota bacterium]
MASPKEIDKAIGAHGMWKTRLKTAIGTGKIDVPVATIRADDQCEFGKWLAGSAIPAAVKGSPRYAEVRKLHAEFHQQAARVAALATEGKKAEAEQAVALTGPFSGASARLTAAMQGWKTELDKA